MLRPITDARIEIVDGLLAGRFTATNEEGRFDFGISIMENQLTVYVTKDGYSPLTIRVRNTLVLTLVSVTLVELDGQHTITFTAASDCAQLPANLRTRTYTATVNQRPSSRTVFTSDLSGSDLYQGYRTFWGVAAGDAVRFHVSSWDAYNLWLEDEPIVEQLGPSAHLALIGTATAPVASSDVSISASFDGSFSYCAATEHNAPPYPPSCQVALVECKSQHHQLTLFRR